jgi:hypothetical protein
MGFGDEALSSDDEADLDALDPRIVRSNAPASRDEWLSSRDKPRAEARPGNGSLAQHTPPCACNSTAWCPLDLPTPCGQRHTAESHRSLSRRCASRLHRPLRLQPATTRARFDLDAAHPIETRFRRCAQRIGTRELAFVPLGDETRVALRSNWPHPSFGGRFLPIAGRRRGVRGALERAGDRHPGAQRALAPTLAPVDGFGVRLIDPVDIDAQAMRATSYGVLLVVLTFGAFWLFEALRRVSIHPVQYGFVGAALAIFFLLLLALSEHLPFGLAYGVAAAACILLIGACLAAVLGGGRTAVGFCAGLTALHAALYCVIRLEDTALLVGALLMFPALACAMLASRRIDWAGFGLPPAPADPGITPP